MRSSASFRLSIDVANRRFLSVLLTLLFGLAATAQDGNAQSGPWPPALGGYYWIGPEEGNGSGAMGDWDNWNGRWRAEAGSPPVYIGLPPEDGDEILLVDAFVGQDFITVTGTGLDLPSSDMSIRIHGALTGGSFGMNEIYVQTIDGEAMNLTLIGTTLSANEVSLGNKTSILDLNAGSSVSANQLYIFGSGDLVTPIGMSQKAVNFNGSTLAFLEMNVSGIYNHVNLSSSTLQGLGINLGWNIPDYGDGSVTTMDFSAGTNATIEQFIAIGFDHEATLNVSGNSRINASQAYIDIGSDGEGMLDVRGGSEVRAKDVNVGSLALGNANADSNGKVFAENTYVGRVAGVEGTINIQDGGRWETDDFALGEHGVGYAFVRDGGTLKIKGDGVLGKAAGSRGSLALIGADAKLELENGLFDGHLTIGDEGSGTLSLSQGAKFTSNGAVSLGEKSTAEGIVSIAGDDSKWTVEGDLNIGVRNVGYVEVTEGGAIESTGAIHLGSEMGGNGTLILDGISSPLTFNGTMTVGTKGTGTLDIRSGMELELATLELGDDVSGKGRVDVRNTSKFKVTGAFKIGDQGEGTLNVQNAATVTTTDAVIAGDQVNSLGAISFDGGSGKSSWTLSSGSLVLGRNSAATLSLAGNSELVAQSGVPITLGELDQGGGEITITGAGSELKAQGDLIVGKKGIGKITINNLARLDLTGSPDFTGLQGAILGAEQNSRGTIEVGAGTLTDPLALRSGWLVVGRAGEGILTIKSGRSVAQQASVVLGAMQGGKGSLDINGDGSQLLLNELRVGEQGTGELKVSNLAYVSTNALTIARESTALIESGGRLDAPNADARLGGKLTIDSGGQVYLGNGSLTTTSPGLQQVKVTGESSGHTPSRLALGNLASGTGASLQLTIAGGGEVVVNDFLDVGNTSSFISITGSGATPSRLAAGRLRLGADGAVNALTVSDHGILQTTGFNGASILGPETIFNVDGQGSLAQINGVLQINGTARIVNGGYLVAERIQITQSGALGLPTGAVVIGGNLNEIPSIPANTILIRPGGRLQGKSRLLGGPTIAGKIINRGGDLIVGASPGLLLVDGDVTLESGTIQMEIGGTAVGDEYDQLQATGAITLGGVLDLQVTSGATGWTVPSVGQEFTLFAAAGGVTGAFDNATSLRSTTSIFNVDWALDASVNEMRVQATMVSLLADFDHNGTVEGADLAIWRGGVGASTGATQGQGDANGDGAVDGADFLIWQRQFGMSLTEALAAVAVVPEPSSMAAMAIGWLGLSHFRRVRISKGSRLCRGMMT